MHSVIVVRVVLVSISVVRDTFDDQPGDGRIATHNSTKGSSLHINSNGTSHRDLDILKRIIAADSAPRSHRLYIATHLVPLSSRRRMFQISDTWLPGGKELEK